MRRKNKDVMVLTCQEKKIANLISKGYSNFEILQALFIEEATFKTHLINIYRKLNLSNKEIDNGTMRVRVALWGKENKDILSCTDCKYKIHFLKSKRILCECEVENE